VLNSRKKKKGGGEGRKQREILSLWQPKTWTSIFEVAPEFGGGGLISRISRWAGNTKACHFESTLNGKNDKGNRAFLNHGGYTNKVRK